MDVDNNMGFEHAIHALLAELGREREKAVQRVLAAQQALAAIDRKRASLQDALAVYREYRGLPPPVFEAPSELQAKFANMTIKDMLVTWARDHDNIIDVGDAIRALVQAGLFSNYRAAAGSIYPILSRRTDFFERIDKGRYRLIGPRAQVKETGGSHDGQLLIGSLSERTNDDTDSGADLRL